ncbi:MAG: DUF4469 domain-containing protein [Treponema sp.]|jgi:hypothetical protein|nr:DUF4469 domain-containing protein [Treponema sp.]
MSLDEHEPVLHRIHVKLHPSNLGKMEGKYFARTASEASQSIEQVCKADMERGGGTGSYDDMVKYVKRFLNEAAYQLTDGFAVDFGFFSVRPHIGGTFDSKYEKRDPQKHPVSFHFRAHAPLKRLTNYIEVEVDGIADSRCIGRLFDQESGTVNEKLTPGGFYSLHGSRIKAAGDDPRVGVYFIQQGIENVQIRAKRISSNTTTKIIGIVPALPAGTYKAAVLTQYVSGTVSLNEPKLIESLFTLKVD